MSQPRHTTDDRTVQYGDPQHDASDDLDPEEATRRRYGPAQHPTDAPVVVGPSDLARIQQRDQ